MLKILNICLKVARFEPKHDPYSTHVVILVEHMLSLISLT
jgi:hypothetical protein